MHRAQDRPPELVSEPTSPRPGVSPAIAFSMLAILVAVIAAAVFLTRPDTQVQAAATNPTSTSPNFALTNEEAIARFGQLNEMRIKMYEARDLSLASEFLTPDSDLIRLATKEVRQLIDDAVVVEMDFTTRKIRVTHNTQDSIVIRQTVDQRPVFYDEDGTNRTASQPQRRVLQWTMVREGPTWLLDEVDVISVRRIGK